MSLLFAFRDIQIAATSGLPVRVCRSPTTIVLFTSDRGRTSSMCFVSFVISWHNNNSRVTNIIAVICISPFQDYFRLPNVDAIHENAQLSMFLTGTGAAAFRITTWLYIQDRIQKFGLGERAPPVSVSQCQRHGDSTPNASMATRESGGAS